MGCFDYAITKVVLFRLGLLFGVLLARWFGIWLCFQWCTDSESELEKLKVSFRNLWIGDCSVNPKPYESLSFFNGLRSRVLKQIRSETYSRKVLRVFGKKKIKLKLLKKSLIFRLKIRKFWLSFKEWSFRCLELICIFVGRPKEGNVMLFRCLDKGRLSSLSVCLATRVSLSIEVIRRWRVSLGI